MTIINVYDMDFNLLGVIDSFVSIIWRPSYSDIGDFEIYLGASCEALELLKQNRLVVRNTDIYADPAGNITYNNVMIIKNIDLVTDIENGDFITVTGKELKFLLHQRIVWSQSNYDGTAEDAIRNLVYENATNPTDSKRKIPKLVLGQYLGLLDDIEKQITGNYLDEAIKDICSSYKYGWEIYGYNKQYVFNLYKGVNRSYDQNIEPYVVFSDSFENLYNTEYQLDTENYANTALVGGEGEGTSRKYTTINNNATGLDRYEMFVDAKDLSTNNGEISSSKYLSMLKERGSEKLAEVAITEGFSGNVYTNGNYVYREDFYLGDTVTVINSYGITRNVMVLSSIESEDENGVTLIPQFNI